MQESAIALGLAVRTTPTLEVLLSQRWQPDRPEVHLKWQFIGGGIEANENAWECLQREFPEEVGCEARRYNATEQARSSDTPSADLIRTHTWDDENSTRSTPHQLTMYLFLLDIGSQIPRADLEEETHDVRWFQIPELESLDTLPQTIEIIYELLDAVDLN